MSMDMNYISCIVTHDFRHGFPDENNPRSYDLRAFLMIPKYNPQLRFSTKTLQQSATSSSCLMTDTLFSSLIISFAMSISSHDLKHSVTFRDIEMERDGQGHSWKITAAGDFYSTTLKRLSRSTHTCTLTRKVTSTMMITLQ